MIKMFIGLCLLAQGVHGQVSQYLNSLIYAQDANRTYLGKASSNRFESDSIINTFGNYGGSFSSTSIRASFSNFGGTFSNYSAYSAFASLPPMLYSPTGVFQAYLTTSTFLFPRVDPDTLIAYLESLNVAAATMPVIVSQPVSQTVTSGAGVAFSVVATGTAPLSYQWYASLDNGVTSAPIPGATNSTLTYSSNTVVNSGVLYGVRVFNAAGFVDATFARLTVVAAATMPVIVSQPVSQTVTSGAGVAFSVVATGTAPLSYQWRKDGTPITGATNSTLTLTSVQTSDAASYTVVVTNVAGSSTSNVAILGATIPNPGRLINLSVLTDIATMGDDFTLGYVVGGNGTVGAKPLVIRAAGPSLGALGVPGTLDDPRLELFAGSTKTGENDNWGGSAPLTTALAAVGAFAYTGSASKDAATTANITTRDNSVKVSAVGSGTGKVIAEIYDATPSASFTTATPRLINVSVRKNLGSGLTMGFVVGGATPAKVLVRGIGPTLGAFGVPGTVIDPQLALFNSSSVKIGENNDWAGTAELTAAFASVGAFGLPATSKDAALLVTLAPGNYTAQVTGVNGTTGVALVEVYEVP
jgi:hypothetical protein